MSFRPDHELHRRRFGRNLGLGGALLAFVILVFALTIEKVHDGAPAAAMLGQSNAAAGAANPAGTLSVKAVSATETSGGTASGGGGN